MKFSCFYTYNGGLGMKNLKSNFEEVQWEAVRDEVMAVNPELASIIDTLDPGKHYPLIKAAYRFGDLIVKEGMTYLFNEDNDLVPMNDISLQKTLKDQLNYSPIPLFLTLENATEVFIHSSHRAIPLNLFYPGNLLGLFESLDCLFNRTVTAKWCVSSGARNLFTLPKINELGNFQKLKVKYELTANKPRYSTDHWSIFSQMAQHPNFEQPWQSTVLFFTRNWLIKNQKDPAWFAFKEYLFKNAWHQAQFAISKVNLNLEWEYFVEAITDRQLKTSIYLTDQVKHILLVAMGRWPGFKTTDGSEQIGPIQGLKKALMEIYNLKKYYPTIMHASSLEKDAGTPLYYSLSYPSLLEGSPYRKKESTVILNLREIKLLLDTAKMVYQNRNKMGNHILTQTQFDYFHVEEDKYQEIKLSKALPDFDNTLLSHRDQLPDREFCATSEFWRGCIRISTPKV
jgi:hypothetical protein